MKKLAKILAIVLIIMTISMGCTTKESKMHYYPYYNNFQSVGSYKTATPSLILGDNIFVSSFDKASGYFITAQKITTDSDKNDDFYLYGIATATEVILEPAYLSIVDIRGDYMIAVRAAKVSGGVESRVGIVCLSKEARGLEMGFLTVFAPAISQYKFLDENLVSILSDKSTAVSGEANFSTIYNYRARNQLLEVCRLDCAYNMSISKYDDNIVVINNFEVRFYRLDKIDAKGYLQLVDTFLPFSEDELYPAPNIETSVYYLGNNWFICNGTYIEEQEYPGYHFIKYDEEGTKQYITLRSLRYNNISKTQIITDQIALVANRYNEEFTRGLADAYNSVINENTDAEGKKLIYYPPVMPVSALVKKGYSIVYHYYFPGLSYIPEVSFTLYDQNANIINNPNIIMPLLFVDKIGLQNTDPNFNLLFGDAQYTSYDDKKITLAEHVAEGMYKITYDTSVAHNNMILVYRYKDGIAEAGAYDAKGNLAIPYSYYELTPFFGNYATGSRINGGIRQFYRVSNTGIETQLANVYGIKNGVYITKVDNKLGLMANDGTSLISNKCKSISILDNFLVDNKFVYTVVIAIEDNHGVIYKLNS